jgi:hypothetical protein
MVTSNIEVSTLSLPILIALISLATFVLAPHGFGRARVRNIQSRRKSQPFLPRLFVESKPPPVVYPNLVIYPKLEGKICQVTY